MGVLNTAIRGAQIAAAVAGDGLSKDGSDNFAVNVDNSSIETSADALQVKALGITNAMLAGSITYAKLSLSDGDVPETKLAIAQGNLIVGDASGFGSELDVTSAQIVIGDASGFAVAVSVTGDVTITNAGVTAIGTTKVTDSMINDDVATGLAGVGLSATTGALAVDLNEVGTVGIDVANDIIAFMDASDSNATKKSTWALLATAIAGTGLTATNGVLAADAVSDNIVEADIRLEDESANCNGATTGFTLAATPVTNSVQVFLNGLLQQAGSGKDYTLSGVTVTFATAPASGDILLIHFIVND